MVPDYKRPQFTLLSERLDSPRMFIQVIKGPRQTGKTTLVKQWTKEASIPFHFASADEQVNPDVVWLAQQWETARLKMKIGDHKQFVLLIDEIQKVPHWSQEVKKQWDQDSWENISLKVVLLGSASLLIHQGLSESLADRFEVIEMTHWSFPEMTTAFNLSAAEYAWFGGYPGAAKLFQDEPRWKDYIRQSLVETTISKDILMLARINKPDLLRRLFEFGASNSTHIFSYNKMLGQLQDTGNTTTLAHYLTLLHHAGLLSGLQNYSGTYTRARASSPKFQVLNQAFQSVFSPHSFKKVQQDAVLWGYQVESTVGAHLTSQAPANQYKVYYWRNKGNEVDFVLEKNGQVLGIEVKSGNWQRAKGMQVFKEKYHPSKIILVGRSGIPWEEFIQISPGDLF